MPTVQQQTRLARLESATEHAEHRAVVLYAHRDDVPRLLAEAVRAGHVSPNHGLLVLPQPLPLAEWSGRAEALRHEWYRGGT